MKVAHWAWSNGSGMARVAESMAEAERKLGIDSVLVDVRGDIAKWDAVLDADIHVCHTHIPDSIRPRVTKPYKVVYVAHGTPEHVFYTASDEGKRGYGHADGFMLCQRWLNTADAIVTFWPRHQWWWRSICQKHTKQHVHCVPLGVDKTFWKPVPSNGKYAGTPSVFTAENPWALKAPLDLFLVWPEVVEKTSFDAKLHAIYVVNNEHRWYFPLLNASETSYYSYVSGITFDHSQLRNAFCSVDYYIGLVRYGDFNRVCMEANASGARTISYRGNPYSDFWVSEGDQRGIRDELAAILRGEVEPRKKDPVPDIVETAAAMEKIYQGVLV